MLPVIQNVVAEAEDYAKQVFPISEIRSGGIRVVQLEDSDRWPPGCGPGCFGSAVQADLQALSSADIVVGLVPHDLRPPDQRQQSWLGLSGGNASAELVSGQGVVVSLVGPTAAFQPR